MIPSATDRDYCRERSLVTKRRLWIIHCPQHGSGTCVIRQGVGRAVVRLPHFDVDDVKDLCTIGTSIIRAMKRSEFLKIASSAAMTASSILPGLQQSRAEDGD
jgi:hypothetical protein